MVWFDFFPKVIDSGMVKKTSFGAIISITMVLGTASLCLSETLSFFNPPIKEQLVSVSDLRGSLSELQISFNITVSLPCALLHVDLYDFVNPSSANDPTRKAFFKMRVDPQGRFIKSTVTAPPCGDCYGAETPEKQCCNSCEDVIQAYQHKQWGLHDFAKWSQCTEEKIDLSGRERCRVYGTLRINAIQGTFHIAPGVNVLNGLAHDHDLSPFTNLNLSHEIDHLTMGGSFEGSPLDRTRVVQREPGHWHYRYNLKAVPKVMKRLGKETRRGFEYTVNFGEIPVYGKGKVGPGIFFTYTFTPVAILSVPDRPSFPIYIARCVSIIGGAFMLAKLVDSFGFRLNTLEGKMRIGKGE